MMSNAIYKGARTVTISASAVSAATITLASNDKAPRAVITADSVPLYRSAFASVPGYNLDKGFQLSPPSKPSAADELQNKLLPALLENPPSVEEAEGAIESLISRPEAFQSLVPLEIFDHPEFGALLDNVRKVVTDPELILAAKTSIEKKKAAKAITTEKPAISICMGQQISKAWSELFLKFPCTICQDVIAAPVVLDCGHSFCGLCINEYYNSCVSDDTEVMHSCPVCKEDFTDDFRYEINYDQCVQYDVNAFPECEDKQKWEQRRTAYLELRKEKEKEAADAKILQELEDEKMWEGAFWVLTCAVIVLIMYTRAR